MQYVRALSLLHTIGLAVGFNRTKVTPTVAFLLNIADTNLTFNCT